MAAATPTNAGHSCGTCTLCCKVMGIHELRKPEGQWCPECAVGQGCRIYETRPTECRTFSCLWLADESFTEEWKPQQCKFVITTTPDGRGLEIRCDPGFPNAWRREPYFSQIVRWSAQVAKTDGTVMVCVGRNGTLITPDGAFPLGHVAPTDRILREYSGEKVVAARVVHPGDLPGGPRPP